MLLSRWVLVNTQGSTEAAATDRVEREEAMKAVPIDDDLAAGRGVRNPSPRRPAFARLDIKSNFYPGIRRQDNDDGVVHRDHKGQCRVALRLPAAERRVRAFEH